MSIAEATPNVSITHSHAESDAASRDDASAYCIDHQLSLHVVPTGGWLIRQTRGADGQQELLGCVDEHHDTFELMQIIGGFRWSTFDTLLQAVAYLGSETSQAARIGDDPVPGEERRFDTARDSEDAPISGMSHFRF